MKARPTWPNRVASIDIQIREIRALSTYHIDSQRLRELKLPTLLISGSETSSPTLKQAIKSLYDNLPNRELIVFEGEEHNAMDTIPQRFADRVTKFLEQRSLDA